MMVDSRCGQAICDDEGDIVVTNPEQTPRVLAEGAPEVRPTQISQAIPGSRAQQHMRNAKRSGIELLINRVTSTRVVELKTKQHRRRQAIAGPAKRNAGGRERSQVNSHWAGRSGG